MEEKDWRPKDYKVMLNEVLAEADTMKGIILKEQTRGERGDPRFKNLEDSIEKIQYY